MSSVAIGPVRPGSGAPPLRDSAARVTPALIRGALGLGCLVLAMTCGPAARADNSALGQLQGAANGTNTTGNTFDGSSNSRPSGGLDVKVNAASSSVSTPSSAGTGSASGSSSAAKPGSAGSGGAV